MRILFVLLVLASIDSTAQSDSIKAIYKYQNKAKKIYLDQNGDEMPWRQSHYMWASGKYTQYHEVDSSRNLITIGYNESTPAEINAKIKYVVDKLGVPDSIGRRFPDLSFTDIDGNSYNSADFEDKVLIINSWFVGCAPCELEKASLNEIYADYSKHENVVLISFTNSNENKSRKYMEKKNFKWPVVLYKGEIKEKFIITGYPTNYILKDGKYQLILAGVENGHIPAMRKEIETLIDQR